MRRGRSVGARRRHASITRYERPISSVQSTPARAVELDTLRQRPRRHDQRHRRAPARDRQPRRRRRRGGVVLALSRRRRVASCRRHRPGTRSARRSSASARSNEQGQRAGPRQALCCAASLWIVDYIPLLRCRWSAIIDPRPRRRATAASATWRPRPSWSTGRRRVSRSSVARRDRAHVPPRLATAAPPADQPGAGGARRHRQRQRRRARSRPVGRHRPVARRASHRRRRRPAADRADRSRSGRRLPGARPTSSPATPDGRPSRSGTRTATPTSSGTRPASAGCSTTTPAQQWKPIG